MKVKDNGTALEVVVNTEELTGEEQRKYLQIWKDASINPTMMVDLYDAVSDFLKKFSNIKEPDKLTVSDRNKIFAKVMPSLLAVSPSKEDFTIDSQK